MRYRAPISETWATVLDRLSDDDAITPMLQGFLNLVEPKGIAAGTFYLEVPNEFTRGMIEQRSRIPLLNAIGTLDDSFAVSAFAIVVNPEIAQDPTQSPPPEEQSYIEPGSSVAPVTEISAAPRANDSRLNPKYSFDNFVIGQSNRFPAPSFEAPFPQFLAP